MSNQKLPIEAQKIVKYYSDLYEEGKTAIQLVEIFGNMTIELGQFLSDEYQPWFLIEPKTQKAFDNFDVQNHLRMKRIKNPLVALSNPLKNLKL